jgi:hydrogenase maturation protease
MVIGYGNPLRQDDGLGLRAAEILEASGIDAMRCHQLTPELAASMAGSDLVIFLDAAANLEPGAVQCVEIAGEAVSAWSHHLTPGQLRSFAMSAYGREPRAVLITGGPFATDFGEGLTDGGEECARQMAATALLVIAGSELHPTGVQPLGHHA